MKEVKARWPWWIDRGAAVPSMGIKAHGVPERRYERGCPSCLRGVRLEDAVDGALVLAEVAPPNPG